ncbi:MAG: sugar transferase [Flavobacteriales bacterium]|nr:sugar transferase [Flavobacteriales bacterium]
MYTFSKRIFDLFSSLIVLLILFPFLLLIAILIVLDSRGGVFYGQIRVGKDGKEFKLLKFRSMRPNSDQKGELTIGNDMRVTRLGKVLRKYKLDELPQLLNIIGGQMSVVGPRPEVPRYVSLYNEEQLKVLEVKPGLTDPASIKYLKEQEILGESEDPEKAYVEEVMPSKLLLNMEYIENRSFMYDLKLIFQTIGKIVS